MPNDEAGTPQWLFDHYYGIYRFTIDVCASDENHKLPRYWTKEEDALSKSWAGEVCWMNPPYSAKWIKRFVAKAFAEACDGAVVVGLFPASTGTRWWKAFCVPNEDCQTSVDIGLGRIQFDGYKWSSKDDIAKVVWSPSLKTLRKQARRAA